MRMNRNTEIPQEEEKTPVVSEEARREARRDFLKKAGRFALYTPPMLTLLMHPSTQAIANSSGVKSSKVAGRIAGKSRSNIRGMRGIRGRR